MNVVHPKLEYGPHDAVEYLSRPPSTAVLVLTDTHQTWDNPGFAQWHQEVFLDMPCNWREKVLCRIGHCLGWHAAGIEQWANRSLLQMWRGNGFPFRPFLDEHAQRIDIWMKQCLADPSIELISIHCVYGKNRSRAVWAAYSGLAMQGNPDVYLGVMPYVKSRTSVASSG